MSTQFIQNIKSGLFWIGLFKTAGQIFIWANTILIARFLQPSDYGLVGMASLITSFVMLIGDFGFGSSIIQKKDLQPIHVYSLFWITASIGMFFLIGIYFGSPLVALFFNNPEVMPILQLSLVALFFNIISDIPTKLLLRNLSYRSSGFVDFVSHLIASISVLIFAIYGFGAYSLVFGSIIIGILKFSFACLLSKWFPQAQFQLKGLRGYVKFGTAIVLDRLLWYAYSNSDYAILAKRLGKVPFGLYSFAFNFACMPTNKLQPILYPVLFSSYSQIQDDLPQLREHHLKIIDFAFTCYAMIYCGFFWVSPEFVKIFLGTKWEPIIPILQILLIIQPLKSISSIGSPVITAIGRPDIGYKTMSIFVAIMVPGFLLASRWGMIGVALAWCLVYPIAFVITKIIGLRVLGIPLRSYFLQLVSGIKFIVTTSFAIFTYKLLISHFYATQDILVLWVNFIGTIIVGTLANFLVLWFFERRYIYMLVSFIKNK